jgi:hypothetical protein
MFGLGFWDWLLIAAVVAQSGVIAYIWSPEWKAFLFLFPIPFSVAFFAVGEPVGASNLLGLVLLLFFFHGVRILHTKLRLNIILSIALSAAGYCLAGAALNKTLPAGAAVFWGSALAVLAAALWGIFSFPPKSEPGHKSPLPVWIKLSIIAAVVFGIVLIKKQLGGFVTVFPMVGVITAYEARKSLWTVSRRIPVMMITLGLTIVIMRLTQNTLGAPLALAAGWAVFLAVIIPMGVRTLAAGSKPGKL